MRTLLSPLALLALSACSEYGSLGVTPGGIQDMGLAREIIAEGGIPNADQFTAEGLFSEHDLPLDGGEPCEALLCPRVGTVDVDPVDGSGHQVLAQVGFDTSVTSVERSPLALALVVDVSGSMGDGKLDAVKLALHNLVPQLNADDSVTLIAFDNRSKVELRLTTMDADGKDDLRREIDRLKPSGGTDIEAGLVDGYAELTGGSNGGRQPWLMLFTDAQPNVGATGPNSFEGLIRKHQEDIGLSVFGVGTDLGAELFEVMAETRNAQGRTLTADADIIHVFDDLDLMVTPIAWDLELAVELGGELVEARTFGAPSARPNGVIVGAKTLFLSRNGGGIGVLLEPTELVPVDTDTDLPLFPEVLGALHLAWTPVDGTREEVTLAIGHEGESVHAGPEKMAVLIDEILALEAAAAMCAGTLDLEEAGARVAAARERILALARARDDADLKVESALMVQLGQNLAGGNCY